MKYHLISVLAALVALLTACEHKPFDDYGGKVAVNVEFDWSEVTSEDIPDNATLYFYDEEGNAVTPVLPTDKGSTVFLDYGVYHLLVTCGSEEFTTTHKGSLDTHYLSLNDNPDGVIGQILGSPSVIYREPANYASPITYDIDPVYAYIIERIELPEGTATEKIIVKPRRVTARYNIIVNNFKPDANIAKIWGGAISGLSATLLPAKSLITGKCAPAQSASAITHPFALNWDGVKTATATLYDFGTPNPDQHQLLHLYVWSDQQSLLSQTYDVTKTIAEAPDPMNVDIIIDFLTSEKENGGYSPEVSDFENGEDHIINM